MLTQLRDIFFLQPFMNKQILQQLIKKMKMFALTIFFSMFSNCFLQQFNFPSQLFIPRGSCRRVNSNYSNMPQYTSLIFLSLQNKSISIEPNSSKLAPRSPGHLEFIFCSINSSQPLRRINIQYYLMTQGVTYTPSESQPLAIYIEQEPENPSLAPIIWQYKYVHGTCAEFSIITPGNNGTIFYSVRNVLSQPYRYLQKLLDYCKQYESSCQHQGSYMIYHSTVVRQSYNTFIETQQVNGNESMIVLKSGLIESTHYNICAFYRGNQLMDNSQTSCVLFQTDNNQLLQRLKIKFTQNITLNPLNKLLCFLTSYLGVRLNDIVTIDGHSCNLQFYYPSKFYYNVKYNTVFGDEIIVYVNYGCGKSVGLEGNFYRIWNSNGSLSWEFRSALNRSRIGYVSYVKNLGMKSVQQMMRTKGIRVQYETFKSNQYYLNQTMVEYKIYNINSQNYGIVYLINILFDLNNSNSNFSFIPTVNQTILCDIPEGIALGKICQRVILAGSNMEATFYIAAIYNTSLFFRKTFYVEVGEYPKFPFPCWREVQEVKFENVNRPVEKKEEIKKKPDSNQRPQADTKQKKVNLGGAVILKVGLVLVIFF